MKNAFKKAPFIFAACALVSFAHAEDAIELPDVTTVVSGGALTAGKDSVPDYSGSAPTTQTGRVMLPQVDNTSGDIVAVAATEEEPVQEKSVNTKGQVGGGYPFMFLGDFTLYRSSGNAPFEVAFFHQSNEGYASEKASDGFFKRITKVSGKKSFNTTASTNTVYASYHMEDDGLQSISDTFYDVLRHTVSAGEDSTFRFQNGVHFNLGIDGNWYNRYGGDKKNTPFTFATDEDRHLYALQEKTALLDFVPHIDFGWESDVGFSIGLRGNYKSQLNTESKDHLFLAEGSSNAETSHRGQATLYTQYEDKIITIKANVGAIVGTAIGDKDVIVPFTIGAEVRLPAVAFNRNVTLFAEGGLFSEQLTIRELETAYHFAFAPAIPVETSDWYTRAGLSFPIFDVFTLDASGEFKTTAYKNGVWAPDYLDANTLGRAHLYMIAEQDERTEFNTDIAFTAALGRLQVTGEWIAYWNDVPAAKDDHRIAAKVLYDTANGDWQLGANVFEALGTDMDKVPNLGGFASYRFSEATRLMIAVDDIVKLLMNKTRDYANSDYAGKSGSVGLFVKFQF